MYNLESEYIARVSPEHRKKFGQFYTIDKIASFMLDWVLEINPTRICDPSFGMGVFFREAKKRGFSHDFVASELDEVAYRFYATNGDCSGLELKNEDYFNCWGESYDAIICNPPYSRFQNFSNRDDVYKKLAKLLSKKVSGYTNSASAFLIKSVLELRPGGRLAYIMPLEFLNAGYGSIVKETLLRYGSIYNIIQITDESGVFEDVTTTVCIILFEKSDKRERVVFSRMESVEHLNLNKLRDIKKSELKAEEKWACFFNKKENTFKAPKGFIPLSVYGKFKRGLATGANDFFALSIRDINKWGLSSSEYEPCITKSQQVLSPIFDASSFNELASKNEKVFVLNVSGELSGSAEEYVRHGEKLDYQNRYLTRNRNPWYSIEARTSAPIWFGVFSRNDFKVIRNKSHTLSFTCYHGFFPFPFFESYIDKIFLFLKSEVGRNSLNHNRRIYGKKLSKFEPNDLNKILVPSMEMFDLIPDAFVDKEMKRLSVFGKLSAEAEKLMERVMQK